MKLVAKLTRLVVEFAALSPAAMNALEYFGVDHEQWNAISYCQFVD